MTIEELTRQLQEAQRDIAELKRSTAHLPARIPPPQQTALPQGRHRYYVLMVVDDAGTLQWSLPRFVLTPAGAA